MQGINTELFTGELVHLVALETDLYSKAFSRWSSDSEFLRLMDAGAARPHSAKAAKEWMEKHLENEDPSNYFFMIKTLGEEKIIGDIGLDGIRWNHGESFVGVGIGEREYWSKGYGTDAMRVILRFAFTELNLWRVSLDVFEYNPRAIRSYEKVGFVHEGRVRGILHRAGKRWDFLYMGITRPEWEKLEQQ